jgi:hypothetical protein
VGAQPTGRGDGDPREGVMNVQGADILSDVTAKTSRNLKATAAIVWEDAWAAICGLLDLCLRGGNLLWRRAWVEPPVTETRK